ncbi:hypothetical protein N7537_010262 [Penicillium hordei]|uniref:Uncharacterized protein n=1 Tax=Penicillium hordei TaxID=40994 RepID=A0AAD6DUA7_9EURO|nr:uncharacterized protein N7537_010262 [Penicillium hordei]KAJ5593358.1 hypothetical protein N7537_010262 [Penicillium hordei]
MGNPSWLMYGPDDARFETRPIPVTEDPNDVTIRIAYVGVGGSDSGKYNIRPHIIFAADPPHMHGTLSKIFNVPAHCCYKISHIIRDNGIQFGENLGLSEAALVVSMAVAVHSVRQAGVQPGNIVVILGPRPLGSVGLRCAAVEREFGATVIMPLDSSSRKMKFALEWIAHDGFLFLISPEESLTAEENIVGMAEWLQILESDFDAWYAGFDVVIGAIGAELCIQMAVHLLRVGGLFVHT